MDVVFEGPEIHRRTMELSGPLSQYIVLPCPQDPTCFWHYRRSHWHDSHGHVQTVYVFDHAQPGTGA